MANVLVIDDDQGIRLLIRDALRDEGIEVETTSTLREAIAALARCAPDVVVLDLRLPDADDELLRRTLQGRPAGVILLSGAMELEQRARRIGAHASLAKPFELDDLLAAVGRFLPHPPEVSAKTY